jgi:hypothetical protein
VGFTDLRTAFQKGSTVCVIADGICFVQLAAGQERFADGIAVELLPTIPKNKIPVFLFAEKGGRFLSGEGIRTQ